MNLPTERSILLNADHRGVAKYSSTNDANYFTVRNTLATEVSLSRTTIQKRKHFVDQENQDALNTFLSLSDEPF